MRCEAFEDRLALMDDELDARALAEMEAHAQGCKACAALMEDARATRALLAQMGELQPPADLHERLMGAVRKEAAAGKPKRRMSRWGIAGIAAAAVVVIALIPIGIGLLGAGYGGGSTSYNASAQEEGVSYPAQCAENDMMMAAGETAPQQPEMAYDMLYGMDDAAYDGGVESPMADTRAAAPEPDGNAHGLKLIRSGYVSLETRTFDEDIAKLEAFIEGYQGYIESSSISGVPYGADPNRYGRWGNLGARIPSQALDAFLAEVEQVGNLLDSSIHSQDVTASYQDTELRLGALTTQHARLNELLAKAESVEDLVSIESKLSEVQYQIDSLTGALRDWDARVDYSSITISVSEVKTYSFSDNIDPTLGERLAQGLRKGFADFAQGAQNLLVFLVSSLPAIALIGALAVAGFLIGRGAIRKARARKTRGDADPPDFDE